MNQKLGLGALACCLFVVAWQWTAPSVPPRWISLVFVAGIGLGALSIAVVARRREWVALRVLIISALLVVGIGGGTAAVASYRSIAQCNRVVEMQTAYTLDRHYSLISDEIVCVATADTGQIAKASVRPWELLKER